MPLRVRLLGRPALEHDGASRRLEGHKPWALLTYLLLEPRPPTRRELADLLWSEADDPLGAVRWSLSQVRSPWAGARQEASCAPAGSRSWAWRPTPPGGRGTARGCFGRPWRAGIARISLWNRRPRSRGRSSGRHVRRPSRSFASTCKRARCSISRGSASGRATSTARETSRFAPRARQAKVATAPLKRER